MKKQSIILTAIFFILFLTACRYDEGPMISFRSVEKRVAQSFLLVEFTKNNVDMTEELADSCGSEWRFFSSHAIIVASNNLLLFPPDSTIPYYGYYDISENKKKIRINIHASGGSPNYIGIEPFKKDVYTTWEIERLKKDEMWLSCPYNNSDYCLKFKKNEEL